MILGTGDRFIDASIARIENYYSHEPDNLAPNSASVESQDESIDCLLNLYFHNSHASEQDSTVSADKFVDQIIHPGKNRTKAQAFFDAKGEEVQWLINRYIWIIK